MKSKDKKKAKKLTPQRKKFVEAYMCSFNGTKAALEAGYAPASAQTQASFLLSIPIVKAEIDARMAEIVAKTDAKIGYLLAFWQGVVEDPKASLSAKLRASDMMAKYLVMYDTSKIEITGKDDGPIKVVWDDK